MNEKLNDSELNAVVVLFTIGTTVLFGAGTVAREDSWIAVIISTIVVIPIAKVYCKLLKLYPGKDLFQIFELISGRWIGKFFTILYLWFAIHCTTLTFFNIVDFINFTGLPNTPILVLVMCLAILDIWMVNKGLKVIGKWSVFFLFVTAILIIGTIYFNIQLYNYENIKPILSQGFYNIYLGIVSIVSTSFSGVIIFTFFVDSYSSIEKFEKVLIRSIVIIGIIFLVYTLENIFVLGVENTIRAHFPGYERLRKIHIGMAFQRLESVISIVFIISEFLRGSIFVLAGSKAIQRLFELEKNEFWVIPAVMTSVNLFFIEYQSILIGVEFLIEVWPYYSAAANIFIPIVLLIAANIKKYLGTL
ncbi:GerAB/ArcD/ProY family transporter [Oceanirhabdus seepicola]|uniref:Endospore germination permease n=1 Tax=Oceanirhabdus seepicola TaxID=2828781 RepID=A0A9J6PB22_9CLOT|nr:endospore germination permease [Oceanirhabdus seepicola]MCM1992477.1 endospore germination permease [Oceanirhabdus seepicola]